MKTVLVKLTAEQARDYHGPVFATVLDDCENIPYGEIIAELKKNRNTGNHNRFFAFVKTTFAMQDVFNEPTDKDRWRKQLLLNAGHVDEYISPKTGDVAFVIRSIAWDELDEIEFRPLFNSVVNAFLKWYGEDLNDVQINTILEY